ncbi:MAG: DUF4368 domain-containing protein [Oscillospiraceae bacterium]|nr:DUF4368 domain-containing protein [Oscillospiraceae bacterium]
MLQDIRRKAHAARRFKSMFVENLTKQTSGIIQDKIRAAQREIERASARKEELEQIIGKLYKDHALGRLSFERYQSFMDKYEAEQRQADESLRRANETIAEMETKRDSAEEFTRVIRQYCTVEELTAPILNELIDRIEIGEKRIIDGQKHQFVRIIYRHVGFVGDYVPELMIPEDIRHAYYAEEEQRIQRDLGICL